ncbi:unnamed protein product, partial [Closterium sp. NIES-53]
QWAKRIPLANPSAAAQQGATEPSSAPHQGVGVGDGVLYVHGAGEGDERRGAKGASEGVDDQFCSPWYTHPDLGGDEETANSPLHLAQGCLCSYPEHEFPYCDLPNPPFRFDEDDEAGRGEDCQYLWGNVGGEEMFDGGVEEIEHLAAA